MNRFFLVLTLFSYTQAVSQDNLELVKELPGFPSYFLNPDTPISNGKLLLYVYGLTPSEATLWTTDGTNEGTEILSTGNLPEVGHIVTYKGKIYYNTDLSQTIWESDGTPEGTKVFLELLFPNFNRGYNVIGVANNKLIFTIQPSAEEPKQLWASDGTIQGTEKLLNSVRPSENPYFEGIAFQGKLFFNGYSVENGDGLWVSDGTISGTKPLLTDLTFTGPTQFFNHNDEKFFFSTYDQATDKFSLWVSDGNVSNTIEILEYESSIAPFAYGAWWYLSHNDKTFFNVDDAVNGPELWVTNGTTAGTKRFTDINEPGDEERWQLRPQIVYKNKVYFRANDGSGVEAVWQTDGTPEGTQVFLPNMHLGPMAVFNGMLFIASQGILYKTDGSPEGTSVVPIPTGPNREINIVTYGGNLYISTISQDEKSYLYMYSNCSETNLSLSEDASICRGDSKELAVNGADSYLWFPSESLNTASSTTVTASPLETTKYTVLGSFANGCLKSKSVIVSVNSKPELVVTNSDEICFGESIELSANGAETYSWSPSESLSANEGNQVLASPTESNTYTITGFSEAGCQDSETISITVNALPDVRIETDKSQICEGERATLTGAGAITYTWLVNGAPYGEAPFIEMEPSTTTTFNIVGTDTNGCSSQSTYTLIVNPKPDVIVDYDKLLICQGESVSFSARGASNYQWSPATGLNTITGSTVIASPHQSIRYKITGISQEGCVDTLGYYLGVTEKAEQPIITLSNVNTETPTLISSYERGNQWFNEEGAMFSATNQSLEVEESGTYRVQVLKNGCLSDFSEPLTLVITGIRETGFKIFPNPTTQFLQLKNITTLCKIVILDVHGRDVMTLTELPEKIDVSSLPSGMYLIKIKGTQTLSAKFIKQ
jgi:ELWxxDGT repeat protein